MLRELSLDREADLRLGVGRHCVVSRGREASGAGPRARCFAHWSSPLAFDGTSKAIRVSDTPVNHPIEHGDIDDAGFAEEVLCPAEEALWHDARLGQSEGQLVDDLLARIVEGRRQARDQGLDLLRRQAAQFLCDDLVLVVRIGSQPAAIDNVRDDLDLGLGEGDSLWK